MFGLEDQNKDDKPQEFVFELEEELKDPKRGNEIKRQLEERIGKLKKKMQAGENKDDYEALSTILHGYTSIVKVMIRTLTLVKK